MFFRRYAADENEKGGQSVDELFEAIVPPREYSVERLTSSRRQAALQEFCLQSWPRLAS